jgi:GntR family transcriptional repressor for pyruvate dehydrogenase complex
MTEVTRQESAPATLSTPAGQTQSWRPGPGETAVDACERAVRRWIVSGELRPGERLPPERMLAVQLGVNRTTLRGALGRLASARLLSVRQGSGYVVQDYRKVAGVELLPELAACSDSVDVLLEDLLEVRRRLARMALERMAERARESDVAAIGKAVEHFAEVVASGAPPERVADADVEVDAAILAATGSPVLGLCLNPLSFVLRDLEQLRDAIYSDPSAQLTAYRILVRWLSDPRDEAVAEVLEELARRDRAALARVAAS